MCIYLYIHTYLYIHMYVCLYIYIYIYIYTRRSQSAQVGRTAREDGLCPQSCSACYAFFFFKCKAWIRKVLLFILISWAIRTNRNVHIPIRLWLHAHRTLLPRRHRSRRSTNNWTLVRALWKSPGQTVHDEVFIISRSYLHSTAQQASTCYLNHAM